MIEITPDDVYALDFSTDIDEPNKWKDKDGIWYKGQIPFTDSLDNVIIGGDNFNQQTFQGGSMTNEEITKAINKCQYRHTGMGGGICNLFLML